MPQNALQYLKSLLPEFVTGEMPPEEEAMYPPITQSDPNYPGTSGPPDMQPGMHMSNVHPGYERPYAAQMPFFREQRPHDIELPNGPNRNLPAPFEAGDPVLDRRDMTASTNLIPGLSHSESQGMERGITMREDRDHWLSGPAYKSLVEGLINDGQAAHRRRLGGQ